MTPELAEAARWTAGAVLLLLAVLGALELGLAWWDRRHPPGLEQAALDRAFRRETEKEVERG